LIEGAELVECWGEIGVIFLMSALGLELNADRLSQMGSLMVAGGALPVPERDHHPSHQQLPGQPPCPPAMSGSRPMRSDSPPATS
jgi:hypothetical protein